MAHDLWCARPIASLDGACLAVGDGDNAEMFYDDGGTVFAAYQTALKVCVAGAEGRLLTVFAISHHSISGNGFLGLQRVLATKENKWWFGGRRLRHQRAVTTMASYVTDFSVRWTDNLTTPSPAVNIATPHNTLIAIVEGAAEASSERGRGWGWRWRIARLCSVAP